MTKPSTAIISVRKATPADAQTIADFNSAMALETEGKAIASNTIGNGVKRLFKQPQYGFYVVAERQNNKSEMQLVGCLMITYEWSDWRDGLFWWIQSVYVDASARRQGVYTSMYQYIHKLARGDRNCCGIRLYVEHENSGAQKTYESLGMTRTDYYMYETDFSIT